MSRRPTQASTKQPAKQSSNKRLERRAEREARTRNTQAPRARRNRTAVKAKSGGFLSNINWLIVGGSLGVIVLVGFLVYSVTQTGKTSTAQPGWEKAELDSSTSLPGVYITPHPGEDGIFGTSDDRKHFASGTKVPICTDEQIAQNKISNPLCYNSNPPTSGPHAESPMAFKILDNPAPKENLVHNMEHGGVVVWYNTDDPNVISQLKDAVQGELDRRRFVVMSKYTEMEPDTIAVTAWTRMDKFKTSDFTKKRVVDFIEEHNKRFNPEGF